MNIGEKIKTLRTKMGLNQGALGEKIGVSIKTVLRWEKGRQKPREDYIHKLASALGVSVGYLMGGSDGSEATRLDSSMIELPIWGAANTACLGAGLPVFDDDFDGETTFVPAEFVGPYDKDNRPFVVRADGESMTDWDIPNGSMVVVNPADEVLNLQIALVCYYDNLSIKKLKFLPSGGVELLASNDKTINIKPEDNIPEVFRVWGKVALVLKKPAHGI